MKVLVILAVMVCAIEYSECFSEQQKQDLLRSMTRKCGEKEGAPEEDIVGIIEMKPTNTHASKCIQACLADAGGIIVDNKLDLEAVVIVAKMIFDDDEKKVEQVRTISTACADVTDDDRCEAAFKIMTCAVQVGKEKGYTTGLL